MSKYSDYEFLALIVFNIFIRKNLRNLHIFTIHLEEFIIITKAGKLSLFIFIKKNVNVHLKVLLFLDIYL